MLSGGFCCSRATHHWRIWAFRTNYGIPEANNVRCVNDQLLFSSHSSRLTFQSHNTLRVSVSDSTISARRPTESYSFLFVHFYEYMKNRRITHIFLRDRNNSSGGDGVVLCLRKPVIASPDERRAHDASCTMWTRCCWFLRVVAALHLWLGF